MPSIAAAILLLQFSTSGWEEAPALPNPITGNAVASYERADGSATVFSVFGVEEPGAGPAARAYRWEVGTPAWEEIAPVPGLPRLGAAAQVVGGRLYVIGGRTGATEGGEAVLGSVDVYDPASGTWSAGAPMPVPVADAVSAVWSESLIYLVSGRGASGPLADVQVYDPAGDRWLRATPIQGPPVFGHAGAIARDAIVYLDGARGTDGALEASAWRGDIDPANPTSVSWARLPDHPGPALFGAAAGAAGTRVLFFGGGDRPHGSDGSGPDGRPAAPLSLGLSYDVASEAWRHMRVPPTPSMDQRSLVRAGGYLLIVGGMEAGARPTRVVRRISVLNLLTGP